MFDIDSAGNKNSVIKRNKTYSFDKDNIRYNVQENGENYDYIENPPPENSTTQTENNNNNDQIELTSLRNGDQVGDFIISNIHHDPKDYSSFTLEGEKWVKAKIFYVPEGYEGYYFSADDPLLSEEITFGSDYADFYYTYKTPQNAYMLNETEVLSKYFTASQREYLSKGNTIEVIAQIKDPSVEIRYKSEGIESVEILNIKANNEKDIKSLKAPYIKGFSNETINSTSIDYSKHKCVIIPMSDTINYEKLTSKSIFFGNDSNGSVSCSIIGTAYDITITYKDHMKDIGSTISYESLTNAHLNIKGPFNFDMSHVKIEGKIAIDSYAHENFDFIIDTVRNTGDYIVLKY